MKHSQRRTVSEKCHINHSDRFQTHFWVKNVSQQGYKCIWIVSEDDIWQFSDSFFLTMFPENDSWYFLKSVRTEFYDRFLTDFYIWHWQFSDTFMISYTFQRHFQIWSDRYLTDYWIWQNSDTNQTHFRHFSDTFMQLTVFWQISDRFPTDFWNFWDHQKWRVPESLYY